jgi:hypothetical protein
MMATSPVLTVLVLLVAGRAVGLSCDLGGAWEGQPGSSHIVVVMQNDTVFTAKASEAWQDFTGRLSDDLSFTAQLPAEGWTQTGQVAENCSLVSFLTQDGRPLPQGEVFWVRVQPRPLVEPYGELDGGSFGPCPVEDSPDPLVTYVWGENVNRSVLQSYAALPTRIYEVNPPGSFKNTASLLGPNVTRVHVPSSFRGSGATVFGPGVLTVDFGVERAAWLELQSTDYRPACGSFRLSISEYNEPGRYNSGPQYPDKTAVPVMYQDGWFRLELNSELYEGVRFGFIHVDTWKCSWNIDVLRVVAQIKPTNYLGSIQTENRVLNRIWWTAAYTVKLNLLPDSFGSILIDRGDRISWTGDAHTAQAAALVAFGDLDLIADNIRRTSCATCSNGIESYALYWVLSVTDFYWYSGQDGILAEYATSVTSKV